MGHQRMAARLREACAALLDFTLPRACAACERPVDGLAPGSVCGRCWARVRQLAYPRCDRCGHPRPRDPCQWCTLLPPFVRAARSVCWIPGGAAGDIVHALKYGGWTSVADDMAARMARLAWPADVVAERRALIPVPLARVRERERGFNQSALLARALATRWRIPVWDDCLKRARTTATQTRLTPEQRRSNVAGAFRATAAAAQRVRGAHVVLVDDVVTTCATITACAGALFEAGTRIISVVTFGRAPSSGDRL